MSHCLMLAAGSFEVVMEKHLMQLDCIQKGHAFVLNQKGAIIHRENRPKSYANFTMEDVKI